MSHSSNNEGPDGIDFGTDDVIISDSGKFGNQSNIFDQVIGILEDVLMDDDFVTLCDTFCQNHCSEFEDSEENKLIYSEIHRNYCITVESYIERRLIENIPDFSMEALYSIIAENGEEFSGDVFDVLNSFSNFEEFKFLMLSHKNSLHGTSLVEGFGPIVVRSRTNNIVDALRTQDNSLFHGK